MPSAIQADLWGLLSGPALVLRVAIAYWVAVPRRVVAAVMAFGSGVLISALSFDLMQEAFESGGFAATALGFLTGAVVCRREHLHLATGRPRPQALGRAAADGR